jgi:hypothetical protein
LKQVGGWSVGALVNHIWSFAGDDRTYVSNTFLQPFVSYATKTKTTFTLNLESNYDWNGKKWTVPVNFMVSQLIRVGALPISLQVGGRYYPVSPRGGPDWGLRFTITPLFPLSRLETPSVPPSDGKIELTIYKHILSRRDNPIVAWHEVPGTAPLERTVP